MLALVTLYLEIMESQRHLQWCVLAALLAVSGLPRAGGQDILAPFGGEYRATGNLPGNQTHTDLAFNRFGGYVIWQDDTSDGQGTAICAQRLNSNLSGSLSSFRVNSISSGHQEKPRIAMLPNGGAVAVWQGGQTGRQNIFARFLTSEGTFSGPDFQINQYTNQFQVGADVAVLADGTTVIVWESYDQDGHLRAVMGRMIGSDLSFKGDEFQINQSTHLNQRSVTIDGLPGGGFVIAWVSERLLGADAFGGVQFTADIMVRKYSSTGGPLGNELQVNSEPDLCANPSIVGSLDDGFVICWSQQDLTDVSSGWDIFATGFTSAGVKLESDAKVNTTEYGDQYAPKLAEHNGSLFVVWTSLGQDKSLDGVYGRILNVAGQPFDSEIQVNTSSYNRQIHPAVDVDVGGRFLAVWSSYVDGGSYFDLHAQRFASAAPLPVMPAPFANGLSQSAIALSWPDLAGFDVAQYAVYIDGAATAIVTTNNYLTLSSLVSGTSYSFRLNYVLEDGRTGHLSPATVGMTWGNDGNFDGLPDDWQRLNWSDNPADWADRNDDSDNDGATNLSEFLAGTNPMSAASVLRAHIDKRGGNLWLDWDAMPGLIYQVQRTANTVDWVNYGRSRFAADANDSVTVVGGDAALFRIVRIR
jgi:hypothetical protein